MKSALTFSHTSKGTAASELEVAGPEIRLKSELSRIDSHAFNKFENSESTLINNCDINQLREFVALCPTYEALRTSILDVMQNFSYSVIRNAGSDLSELILLATLIGKNIFTSDRLGIFHNFKVDPYNNDISESVSAGMFHTDFSSVSNPPRYIAIQCVEPDPRHPFFGRNQVAPLTRILKRLNELIPESVTNLELHPLAMNYGGSKQLVNVLNRRGSESQIRIHNKLVDVDNLDHCHFYDGVPIVAILEQVCKEVCDDFALDCGDVLIVDNWHSLHRRGEATVMYSALNHWTSRSINTIRFY